MPSTTTSGEKVVIRITDDGQVFMRNDKGVMVQVSLTDHEVIQLQMSTSDSRLGVLAAIIARLARPN